MSKEYYSMIESIVIEEYERLLKLVQSYQQSLASYPKGKLVYKVRRGKEYLHLQWREGVRVHTKYVHHHSHDQLDELREQIRKRDKLLEKIKITKQKIKSLEKGFKMPKKDT